MNNIKTLSKYAFKEQFFPYLPSKNIAGLPKNYLARLITIIWSYGLLAWIFFSVSKVSVKIFIDFGIDYMYFALFAMIVTILVLSVYATKIIADMFSDKAIGNYLTLPISQEELFLGKIFGGVLSFVDYYAYFILSLFIFSESKGFDILTLILGLLNFFPMVLIPYTLVGLLIMLVKGFTSINSHKKLLKNLGYVFAFAVAGIIYYYIFSASSQGSFDLGSSFVDVFKDSSFSNIFFQAKLFGLSLVGPLSQRLLASLILYLAAFIILALSAKLAGKVYFKSVFASDKPKEDKEAKDKKRVRRVSNFTQRSQLKALTKRDLKVLFNNLIFLYQPALTSLIFVIIGISTMNEGLGGANFNDPLAKYFSLGGGFLIGILIWINSSPIQNALSREGASFYHIQTLPIDPKSHMLARLLSASLIALVFNVIMSVAVGFILKLGLINSLMIFIGLSLGSLFANIVGLYLSTIGISINWKNPKELMQGNFRAIGYYLASMVGIGLLIGLGALLMNITGENMLISILIPILICLIIALVFYSLAKKSYKKGFMDV
ncbi:MAG: hypothetical protein Q4D88_00140 [Anaerococcus sp.]|nr:hypothetical protein [Anaerococcus sp.]